MFWKRAGLESKNPRYVRGFRFTAGQLQRHRASISSRLRLAHCRWRRRYSQEGFADACKFHGTCIGAIERGEKNVTLDSVERIAKTLKITPFELFREAEKEGP